MHLVAPAPYLDHSEDSHQPPLAAGHIALLHILPPDIPLSNHFLCFITLVIACRIVMPARSISFLLSPVVTHTFSAGCGSQTVSLAEPARGMLLRRVMSTPLARVC